MKQSTCGAVICQPGGDELKHDILLDADEAQSCELEHSLTVIPHNSPIERRRSQVCETHRQTDHITPPLYLPGSSVSSIIIIPYCTKDI